MTIYTIVCGCIVVWAYTKLSLAIINQIPQVETFKLVAGIFTIKSIIIDEIRKSVAGVDISRQSNDTMNISYVSINAYFKIASIWNLRNSVSFSLIQRDYLFINSRTILLSSTYSVSIYLQEITHLL
jgi:hypothetical protein